MHPVPTPRGRRQSSASDRLIEAGRPAGARRDERRRTSGKEDTTAVALVKSVKALSRAETWRKAQEVLLAAVRTNLQLSLAASSFAIKASKQAQLWSACVSWLRHLGDAQLLPDIILYSSIASSCISDAKWKNALRIQHAWLTASVESDIYAKGAIMRTSATSSKWARCLRIMDEAGVGGLEVNQLTYGVALGGIEQSGAWQAALTALGDMFRRRVSPNIIVYSTAVSACKLSAPLHVAIDILQDARHGGIQADVALYSSLLDVSSRRQVWRDSANVFAAMRQDGAAIDIVAVGSMFKAFTGMSTWRQATSLLGRLGAFQVRPDSQVFNGVLAMHKQGAPWPATIELLGEAGRLFGTAKATCYRAALDGLSLAGAWRMVLVTLMTARRNYNALDRFTLSSAVAGCSGQPGAWRQASRLVCSFQRQRQELDAAIVVATARAASAGCGWRQSLTSLTGYLSGGLQMNAAEVAGALAQKAGDTWALATSLLAFMEYRSMRVSCTLASVLIAGDGSQQAWAHGFQLQMALQGLDEGSGMPALKSALRDVVGSRRWEAGLRLLREGRRWLLEIPSDMYSDVTKISQEAGWEQALGLLRGMEPRRLATSTSFYNMAIRASITGRCWETALEALRGTGTHHGVRPDAVSHNMVIGRFEKRSQWQRAVLGLSAVTESALQATAVSWNSVLGASDQGKQWARLLTTLKGFLAVQIEADSVSCTTAVSASENCAQWVAAGRLLDDMLQDDLRRGIISLNAATSAAGRGSIWKGSCRLLEDMSALALQADFISRNAALSAVEKGGERWDLGLHILWRMADATLQATDVSLSAAITCCEGGAHWQIVVETLRAVEHSSLMNDIAASAAALLFSGVGQWLRSLRLLEQQGLRGDTAGCSAALAACEKAGQRERAPELLQLMADHLQPQPDMFSPDVDKSIEKSAL
eukprot:TRINITY_DN12233_c1_g1_i1.p1 TRINITY_DN12233_c1_g1~~TRINITY_DN12233_c1_g1_i1.p1  ORF type:complete len:932 (+),score=159.68 TRINITY_DN12233_c1_g1_i1:126-2921(+)